MRDSLIVRGAGRSSLAALTWALLVVLVAGTSTLGQDGTPTPDASPAASELGGACSLVAGCGPDVRPGQRLASRGPLRRRPHEPRLSHRRTARDRGASTSWSGPAVIRIVQPDGTLVARPFLDISSLVTEGAEQGLHSVAFHPDFGDNGRFFVHYNDKDGWSQIAEFRGRPCRTARQRPVRMLLREDQPFLNNNAGWIGFGPDGYLYIPLGDGGGVSPGDPLGIGQDATSRLSKVLRIDVDVRGGRAAYRIPRDNPFAAGGARYPARDVGHGPARPAARQLRPRDGRPLDRRRRPGPLRGGRPSSPPASRPSTSAGPTWRATACHNLPDCDPTQYALPVHTYDSVSPHCGIVGGYVYRGAAIPALDGVYLFSDFCSGFIWGLDAAAVARGEAAPAHLLLDAPQGFASLGEDDDGELYAVSLDGSIFRIGAESG